MKEKQTKLESILEPNAHSKDFDFYILEAESNIRKLDKLFPRSLSFVEIHFFKSRSFFLKAIDKKSAPSWLVAYVPPNTTSKIFLFCKYDKKKDVMKQVLLHEITHLYTNNLNPHLADWLKEGISVYIAQQIFKTTISTSDWTIVAPNDIPFENVSWEFATEHNGYTIAGLIVMFLVRRYGWNGFIETIDHYQTELSSSAKIFSIFNNSNNLLINDFKHQFVKESTS